MDVLQKPSVSTADMIRIPGGIFRMGSDGHYAEEAPAHTIAVNGFWIDPTPITNAQFRAFSKATGHITWAEIAPDAKDYPSALPHRPNAGGLVFKPPSRNVDLRDWSQCLSSLSEPTGAGPTARAVISAASTVRSSPGAMR